MSFSKNLTITVRNTIAQLDEPLYVYEKDRNLIMYFKIMDYKYKFDKKPTNVLASVDDIMEAYATIVDPNGYELTRQYGEVIEDEIKFIITDDLIDELNEIGTYRIQFHIKCQHSEFTIPEISFEVLERLKGFRTVTDEGEVGDEILNNSESFIDEEGKLHLVWREGDTISSVRLNQMVEVVNNAVDEEHQRQINEVNRENRANAKLEELETRFSALTTSQQSAAEVIDARDGEVSLKVRLDRDVNTHTEQISNLNKELDRVKQLEESTVSTVTTESDFTTVEATSNGYFEDVKLEGKTLVNKFWFKSISDFNQNKPGVSILDGKLIMSQDASNTSEIYVVTRTNFVDLIRGSGITIMFTSLNTSDSDGLALEIKNSNNITRLKTYYNKNIIYINKSDLNNDDTAVRIRFRVNNQSLSNVTFSNLILLEGDHTQNPPSYFEGLKSVGDGTDEIVVSSVNENLFDVERLIKETNATRYENGFTGVYSLELLSKVESVSKGIVFEEATQYTLQYNFKSMDSGHGSFKIIYTDGTETTSYAIGEGIKTVTSTQGKTISHLSFTYNTGTNIMSLWNITLNKGTTPIPYTPHQSDKKRLLYYNEETQTWEKPILRQWDSIEKHSDGKYYYHQRSGEVVLNGSESWTLAPNTDAGFTRFYSPLINKQPNSLVVCDTYLVSNKSYLTGDLFECVGGFSGNNMINLKLVGDVTVEQLKQKLQTNNVTVVYQLAQEKVYECTNIDLITYANETNYIVECGAIVPKTTLKVHSNIANVISALQKKVSVLESNYVTLFNTITVTFNSLE